MNPYITIPLYCPIHDRPDRPICVSPQEINDAEGYIVCDTCGQPMHPIRPYYIVEHPYTNELYMRASETIHRFDGTPIEAPKDIALWPIHGAVTSLKDWQTTPEAWTLRRYTSAHLISPEPGKTFLAGGHSETMWQWAMNFGYTIDHQRCFATPHDARNFAEANNGIAW